MTHTREEMLARLAELRAANEAATSWGAAVGARSVEIRNLERSLAASASDGVQTRIPDGQQCNEQSAQGLSRATGAFNQQDDIAEQNYRDGFGPDGDA